LIVWNILSVNNFLLFCDGDFFAVDK
jgi:hypothetical protein